MSDKPSLEFIKTWKVSALKEYCVIYGLSVHNKTKDELQALTYSISQLDLQPKESAKELELTSKKQYQQLLELPNGTLLPDPLTDEEYVWVSESESKEEWPKVSLAEITDFFAKHDGELRTKALTKYKTGKAYEYFVSNWVKQICSAKFKEFTILKTDCTPSLSINKEPHHVWICLDKTGSIQIAYCTCTAGLNQSCNRVAGVLFRLESLLKEQLQTTCTMKPCKWTVPATKKTVAQPIPLSEMDFTKSELGKTKNRKLVSNKKRSYKPHDQPATTFCEWENLLSGIANDACIFKTNTPSPSTQENYQQNLVTRHFDLKSLLDESAFNPDPPEDNDVNEIQEKTVGQSSNPNWKFAKQFRITASIFHEVQIKNKKIQNNEETNINETCEKIKGGSLLRDISWMPAVKHGIEMEPMAKEKFKELYLNQGHENVIFQECGLYIHAQCTFIGASPDLIVGCSCCGISCVVSKCPYSVRDFDPNVNLPYYMKKVGDHLKLNESHSYFTQIQGQMGVVNVKSCYFFVYTKHGYIIQKIDFNLGFWQTLLHNLQSFYLNMFIPTIIL